MNAATKPVASSFVVSCYSQKACVHVLFLTTDNVSLHSLQITSVSYQVLLLQQNCFYVQNKLKRTPVIKGMRIIIRYVNKTI